MCSPSPRSRPTIPLLKQSVDLQLTKTSSQQNQQQVNQHKSQSVSSASKFDTKTNKQHILNYNDKHLHPKTGNMP
jgi:hypothetical protein